MNKLLICICENLAPEIAYILNEGQEKDVEMEVFPCLCLSKAKKEIMEKQMQRAIEKPADRLLICSNQCPLLQQIPKALGNFEIIMNVSCFAHLIPNQLLEYITEKGGYVVSTGWLQNWRENLSLAGFDSDTAKDFFGEFCKELICLDLGLTENIHTELQQLSRYLNIPCRILPVESERIRIILNKQILEWRFRNKFSAFDETIKKLKQENAEYASLLHMMKGISLLDKRRDVIEQIKEMFLLIFGASQFNYSEDLNPLPLKFQEAEELLANHDKNVLLLKNGNGLLGKVMGRDWVIGLIKAEEFLFPQYIERYMVLISGILQICGIVLENLIYLENIEKQKEYLQYLNFHDQQTQLYNRAYFENALESLIGLDNWAVFMADLDGMKQINDNYGHSAGDEALILAALALKETFRESDIIARIGGDEFAVLVKDCDAEIALQIQKRLLAAVERQSSDERAWKLSLSSGFAVNNDKNARPQDIVKEADQNMYQAKRLHKK